MKKRILSLALAGVILTSFMACGKSSQSSTTPSASPADDSEEIQSYTITACLSENNEYNDMLLKGFSDALSDYLGEDNITINKLTVSEDETSDIVAEKAVSGRPDMIFTTGKQMLLSASSLTEDIPIVATDIVDFKDTLRIADPGSSSWDKTTGINVTGISSRPSSVDMVSLMIEATKDLQTVGILFSPEDTDSIAQNELFEKYLDQAGIPWKEYLIPATDAAIIEESDQNTEVLTPNKLVAPNAKSGMDNNVETLGENIITGINSASSTRVAQISKHWTGGKVIVCEDEENADEDSSSSTDSTTNSASDKNSADASEEESIDYGFDADVTLEQRIQQVCDECSTIYIPYGSMLTDQMAVISQIATASGVTTVGGDTAIGQNTLVALFYDPYDLGYSAGKKAQKVLNGADITTLKIAYGDSDDVVKLYNKEIAEQLGLTFPKSFSEINEFLETYEYGSKTTRHEASTE